MNGTLELRGLDAAACYAMKGHAGNLGPSAVWGPGSTAMLSNVVPLPLSHLGLALGEATRLRAARIHGAGTADEPPEAMKVVWITPDLMQA